MDMNRNDRRKSLCREPDHPSGATEVVDVNQFWTLSVYDGLQLAKGRGSGSSE
jgi:hypothetical protein